MIIKKWLIVILIASTIFGCSTKNSNLTTSSDLTSYSEKYRPQFHFSPAVNWMNDPNGLVFYDGEYHLFYQYNPYGTTWGHMSWGHAVTKDLLHWENLPVAIREYQDTKSGDSTMIFSGTVVVDTVNTSGLCTASDCMIAIFTSHVHKNGEGLLQHQSLAYSNDKGRIWTRYGKNPVLSIDRKDFRDPKIFWHEESKSWIMVLVIPDLYKVRFYKSSNLKEWALLSEFGNIGDIKKIWECPDLYQLPVTNDAGKKKWVLSLSGSHPAGSMYVGVQYFIGEFDGVKFIADDPKQPPMYVDYGKDFYAGIIFNNIPKEDGRTIMLGWANNWAYANKIPTSSWRSTMSLPRELSLKKTENGLILTQQPVSAITSLRKNEITDASAIEGNQIEVEMTINTASIKERELSILKSDGGKTIIGYNKISGEIFIDRTKAGNVSFHKDFSSIEKLKVNTINSEIKLHIFIDHSIIEVFINDGEFTMSEQFFPDGPYKIASPNDAITVKAWILKSTWKD